jgi:pimeloyl-ACP methyl ester carboxylesterase
MTTANSALSSTRRKGSPRSDTERRGHIGWIVAGSLATGIVAALLLAAAPFIPPEESPITGAVLCGFGLGWAVLAVLSVRLSDQPQRWAAAPALFMGLGGLLLLGLGAAVRGVLSWLWPPALLALAIWMFARAHRELRRSGRWLLYPVITMMAVTSVGGGFETVREAADAKAYPLPGELLVIGGHRLHLRCTGSGSPAVVLEPGGGEMSSNLAWIAPAVARDTRVCVYDRAGRGWSEASPAPQDAAQIAADLHTLLQRGNVPGPYVLAGHSFGGLYVLTFAARYPDDVAGMVLVDTTAPASADEPVTASSSDGSYDAIGRVATLVSTTARLGVGRLYFQSDFGSLPPRSRGEVRAKLATAGSVRGTIDEFVQATASRQQAASLHDFDDKPLAVLTAEIGSDAAWIAAHVDLAALSTNSVHRVIEGATHQTLIADHDDSAATTQAILDVVSSVRRSEPLG